MSGFLDNLPLSSPRRRRPVRRRRPPAPPVPPAEVAASLPCITFYVNLCPHCGSTQHRVYTKNGRIRYHACAGCGQTFKSVEKVVENQEM